MFRYYWRHTFCYEYELDTSVAVAVATYLDVEHYMFLHHKYSPDYEIIHTQKNKTVVSQHWKLGFLKVGQTYTAEYLPPARFKNYDLRSNNSLIPNIHSFVGVTTDLKYESTNDGKRTKSILDVELDIPFWLWAFRKTIENKIKKLKWEKDLEDIAMIKRREALFGFGNYQHYLKPSQFMLHKDSFMDYFGPSHT
jgi:hypothetical protein